MAHPKIVALRELLEHRHGAACLGPGLPPPPECASECLPECAPGSAAGTIPGPPSGAGRGTAAAAGHPTTGHGTAHGLWGARLFRTGVPVLDAALGGGLPGGSLVELTCAGPGGSALLVELLVRSAGVGWTALVDGSDALDPGGLPAGVLRRLLWVRCGGVLEALQATELLARDGNLPLLVVDLRGEAGLRTVSPALWHRIRLGLEPAAVAAVVFTRVPAVASARNRLRIVPARWTVDALDRPRGALVAGFQLEFLRGGHRAASA